MLLRGMSACTFPAAGNSGIYGYNPKSRRCSCTHTLKGSHIISGADRHFSSHSYALNLMPASRSYRRRQLRTQAGWLFSNNDASKSKGLGASSERSERSNRNILVFFLELDLATRVQYALNLEQYDIAQELRNKLTEVEEESIRERESNMGSTSKSEVQDQGIRVLRMRAELQDAVEKENYAQAAEIRDAINKLEAETLAASAKAMAYDNVQYKFRLGQKVIHKTFGYRGVICGLDPICCESRSWMETANVDKLSRGPNQPFYEVLLDMREDPELAPAYVAEENLVSPEKPDLENFDHPYTSFLFYGVDTAGDFIPVKQLREKYNQPRYEVPFGPDDEDKSDGEN